MGDASLSEPVGLRRLISTYTDMQVAASSTYSSSALCLGTYGDLLSGALEYKTRFDFYTAGHMSLQQEFPGEIKVYPHGTDDALHICKGFVESKYPGLIVDWMVNALPLTAIRKFTPKGHLGNHPINLACFLGSQNEEWRLEQYVLLWIRMQCTFMRRENDLDTTVSALYICRQGKHRSFGWSLIEAAIMGAFGFVTHHTNVCRWTQQEEKCQREGYPRGCKFCGNVLSA
jgi:hypothetical protein